MRPYRVRRLIVECSVCSKDRNLFPEIQVSRLSLYNKKKNYPCGCSNYPAWTEDQNRTRVVRKCIGLNYMFMGWEGEYKGFTTKLRLCDYEKGVCWNSTSIDSLLNSGTKNPVFKTTRTIPKAVREKELIEKLQVVGGSFISWEEVFKGNTTKFNWYCKEGHRCTTIYSGFMYGGRGCKECKKVTLRSYGFFYGYLGKAYDNKKDVLYVLHFDEGFIKIGRSLKANIFSRMKNIRNKESKRSFEIVYTFEDNHSNIYDLEQHLHKTLENYNIKISNYDSSELFSLEAYKYIPNLLDDFYKCRDSK